MKHTLIIGGTAGIGRELAISLYQDGGKVTIAGRDAGRARSVASEILSSIDAPGAIDGIAADLSNPELLPASLALVEPIDHLVLVGMVRDANSIKNYNVAGAMKLATTRPRGLLGFPSLSKSDSRLSFGGSHGCFGSIGAAG
ncbi:SDR family NAD(P)-dependent oxidoreductase [Rhizobium ruizarguesonis]|uniref:SDR family NAD(P)-dependent oxidoreductase n=1 Tax=Rhizobium ruizarguesonis TaxID=2081791 RepID=UPI0013EE8E00